MKAKLRKLAEGAAVNAPRLPDGLPHLPRALSSWRAAVFLARQH